MRRVNDESRRATASVPHAAIISMPIAAISMEMK